MEREIEFRIRPMKTHGSVRLSTPESIPYLGVIPIRTENERDEGGNTRWVNLNSTVYDWEIVSVVPQIPQREKKKGIPTSLELRSIHLLKSQHIIKHRDYWIHFPLMRVRIRRIEEGRKDWKVSRIFPSGSDKVCQNL